MLQCRDLPLALLGNLGSHTHYVQKQKQELSARLRYIGKCAPQSTYLGQDTGLYHCGAKDVVCIEEGVDEGYGSICRAGGIDAPQYELQRNANDTMHAYM
jgi:hypothetical protein